MRLIPFLFISAAILLFTEIYIFIQISKAIGLLTSIVFLLIMFLIGIYLVKRQGRATLNVVRLSLTTSKLPAEEMLEGLVIITAALLLLFPGFLTDFIALLLLVPRVRHSLIRRVIGGRLRNYTSTNKKVIEGEVIRERDK